MVVVDATGRESTGKTHFKLCSSNWGGGTRSLPGTGSLRAWSMKSLLLPVALPHEQTPALVQRQHHLGSLKRAPAPTPSAMPASEPPASVVTCLPTIFRSLLLFLRPAPPARPAHRPPPCSPPPPSSPAAPRCCPRRPPVCSRARPDGQLRAEAPCPSARPSSPLPASVRTAPPGSSREDPDGNCC